MDGVVEKRRRQSRDEIYEHSRAQGAAEWSATHDKELAFQLSKEEERKIDGYRAGELLPAEVSQDLPRDN